MKKVDLHVHTIATEKDADFVFDIDKLQLYVQISKLDAIAITNHNTFDKEQFNSIKEKMNISVFPGVEVDVENAHMIVITDESDLDNFCEQCNQLKEKMEDGRKFISYDEAHYIMLLNKGILTAQQARQVLPNALKTELVMTGFVSDYQHFFDLRARGTTGAPHPDAKALAEPLMCEFKKRGWI